MQTSKRTYGNEGVGCGLQFAKKGFNTDVTMFGFQSPRRTYVIPASVADAFCDIHVAVDYF